VPPGWGRPYKEQVARRLRELREERGLTQRELAQRAGMSPANLCFLESGETLPLPATQRALAGALGMDERDLIVRLSGDPHAR
jgi:transcriptional regulator with XRE-family HTH domain